MTKPLGRFTINKTPQDVDRAVKTLIARARREIPYYRDLLTHMPESIDLDTLHTLPITTKNDLVMQQDSTRVLRTTARYSGRRLIGTSGTTGQVLYVQMSRTEALFRSYSFFRSLRENTETAWPLTLTELGVGPQFVKDNRPSVLQRLSLVRLTRIPRLLPTADQADQLVRSHPQVITGQATCLEAVAQYLLETGQRVRTKLVVSRGEVLASHVREVLERAFDGRVVDYYNCEEVGNVAYQCPADSSRMHVNTDCCVLEIVNKAGEPIPQGDEGHVVATNLFNHTMPFIRYALGDLAAWISKGGERCVCGSYRPTIFAPLGRADDYFWFEDGTRMSPRIVEAYFVPPMLAFLAEQDEDMIGSPRYEIIQVSERLLRFRVAGHLGFQQDLARHIQWKFREDGHDVSIVVEENASLPVDGSGKARCIVSQVKFGKR
jgi:phenylacetate-coenzyme A ligase PaaK-like adenylate-forming protein